MLEFCFVNTKCSIELNILTKYHELSKSLLYRDRNTDSTEVMSFEFERLVPIDEERNWKHHGDFDLEERAGQVFFHEKLSISQVSLSEEEKTDVNGHVDRMLSIVHNFIEHDLALLMDANVDIRFELWEGKGGQESNKFWYDQARNDLKEMASLLYMREIAPNSCKIAFNVSLGGTKLDEKKQVVINDFDVDKPYPTSEMGLILDFLIDIRFQRLRQDPNPIIRSLLLNLQLIDKRPLEPSYSCISSLLEKIKENKKQGNISSQANLFRGMLAHTLNRYIRDAIGNSPGTVGLDTSIRVLIYCILLSFGLIELDWVEKYTTNKEKEKYIKRLSSKYKESPRIIFSPKNNFTFSS